MLRAGGYATIISPESQRVSFGLHCEEIQAGLTERDTYSCFHCNSIVHTPVRLGPNDLGFCRNCMQRICQRCCNLPCRPFEKWLEQTECGIKAALERERVIDSYGL